MTSTAEQIPGQLSLDRAAADRATVITRLRAMADWLEASPAVPLSPYITIAITAFASSEDDARAIRAAAPGGWRKDTTPETQWITYCHGDDDARNQVVYQLNVNKEATACERVQTGTVHVPAHDEPVYEWKCGPGA
jgi:hypothetical protein